MWKSAHANQYIYRHYADGSLIRLIVDRFSSDVVCQMGKFGDPQALNTPTIKYTHKKRNDCIPPCHEIVNEY